MKRIRRIIIGICIAGLFLQMQGTDVQAATGSATLSGASGKVGSTVTVTGSIKAKKGYIGSAEVTLTYDPSALQYVSGSSGTNGGSGSAKYAGVGDGAKKSLTYSMKFKILKEGSHKISGIVDAYDWDAVQLSVGNISAGVNGKVEETKKEPEKNETKKDHNTKLKSLKIYPGTLSPSFAPDTRSYTVTVPDNTKEVMVSATLQSAKAKFYVTGTTNLKQGNNYAAVVVTAEDGTTGKYSMTIVVNQMDEEEPEKEPEKEPDSEAVSVLIDGVTYTIREDFAKKDIPTGFEQTNVTYEGKEYLGAAHSRYALSLLYLENETAGKSFYIYDETGFYPFLQLKISEIRKITPVRMTQEDVMPQGMTKATLMLKKRTFDAWNTEDKECYIFPAVTDDGERRLYQYDVEEGTIQRYFERETVETEDPLLTEKESILPDALQGYEEYLLIAATGVIVILLILVLALGVNADKRRRKKLRLRRERRGEEEWR